LAAAYFNGQKGSIPQKAQEIAAGIADQIGIPDGFSKVEAVKGYLNLTFDPALYTRRVIDTVLELGGSYGRGKRLDEQVMVEFPSRIPTKRSTWSFAQCHPGRRAFELLDAAGYDVVRANYPGDMGLHVIKWLWNYENFHLGEKPGRDITRWMGDLYV